MVDDRRVLIVGCGRIAGGFNDADEGAVLTHAVAYRRLGARIVGCCDTDADRAARFAARWEVAQWDTDLARLLASCRPEVVSVCTPPVGRVDELRVILSAPSVRGVLLEKPIALARGEADAILALSRGHGKPVVVNFPRAFDPFYLRLEKETRDGTLGRPRGGVARYYGAASTNASHWLERLIALFGAPRSARRIAGSADQPVAALELDSMEILLVPSANCRYAAFELDLLFEEQRLRVVDSERRAEHFRSMPDPDFPQFCNLVPTGAWDGAAPSHEAVGRSVDATMRLAAGEVAAVGWWALLDRAALTVDILERIGAPS
jgi:hypothetical protein